jgi:hypothetical protein
VTTEIKLSAKADYRSVEEFEAGFCDRIAPDCLFLSRAQLAASSQDLPVGAPVHLVVQLLSGTVVLELDGVVVWSYPRDLVPPGRDAGAGIAIERADPVMRARLTAMATRPGAGARVREPGRRVGPMVLNALRASAHVVARAGVVPSPVVIQPLAASSPTAFPAAPAPRMVGLLADQTFHHSIDVTPSPMALAHVLLDSAPPASPPLAGTVGPTSVAELPDVQADIRPSSPGSGPFEQRHTDVDVLVSLSDGDFVAADIDSERRRAAQHVHSLPFAAGKS